MSWIKSSRITLGIALGFIATIASISGVSILNLAQLIDNWYLSVLLFVVIILIALIVSTSLTTHTTVKSRNNISKANKRILASATQEVISFSGDLSWIEQCQAEVEAALNRGIIIRILCREPRTAKAKVTVARYLNSRGVTIRYYPTNLDPDVRGLIMDPAYTKLAFLVEKKHRTEGYQYRRDGEVGDSYLYEYWGQWFNQVDDFAVVSPLVNLFNAIWLNAVEATIIEQSDWSIIVNELKKINQYANARITIQSVNTKDLLPLHRFIEQRRYETVKQFRQRMIFQNYSLWESVEVIRASPSVRKVICPPIVEKHGNDYLVVDGLARIFCARQEHVSDVIVCIIENASMPLAGKPWEWNEVSVVPHNNINRDDNFREYDSRFWRNIKETNYMLSNQPVQ